MARTLSDSDIAAYRDAIGTVLATRREDEDAVKWLRVFQPSLGNQTSVAFVALICALMRELDRMDADATALVERWAANLADYGSRK